MHCKKSEALSWYSIEHSIPSNKLFIWKDWLSLNYHIFMWFMFFFPLYWKWKCYSVVSDSLWSSVHGILQARILDWVAISFSRGPSWPRHWSQVSHIAGRFFTIRATWKTQINRVRTTQVLTQRDNSGLAWNWITEDNLKDYKSMGSVTGNQLSTVL